MTSRTIRVSAEDLRVGDITVGYGRVLEVLRPKDGRVVVRFASLHVGAFQPDWTLAIWEREEVMS